MTAVATRWIRTFAIADMKKLKEKQLAFLKKSRQRQPYPGYLMVFSIIIILMRVTNELSSNISTYIQSSVVNEFFVSSGFSYEGGLARFTFVNMTISLLTLLTVFYKPLADKLGRKTILCINAIGTVTGMLFTFTSPTVYFYCFGVALYTFFMQNDVQMVYILETAPKDKGARLFGVIKSFGILGLVIIPILRDTVMNNDAAKWRNLFFIPLLVCIAIVFLLLFCCRETRMFLDKRIAYLEHSEEGLAASRESEKRAAESKTGLLESIKYIWKTRALRTSIIAYTFYGLCSMAAYMYVESIMTTNGMSPAEVTKALYVYPFVYAGLSFLGGFVADKFGRKPVVVAGGTFVALGFLAFIHGCRSGWNPYLIGLLNGIYLGGYWVCGDYISVMFLEKVPTELRASVLAGANVLMLAGCLAGIGAEMLLMLRLGLNLASTLIIVPCITICTLIILFRVHETKGTDLKTVKKEV